MSAFEWTLSPKRLNHLLARTIPVQDELEAQARTRAAAAEARLARHRDTGASHILVEGPGVGRIKTDWYIVLEDTERDGSPPAAAAIENNLWILRQAAGYSPPKRLQARKKRRPAKGRKGRTSNRVRSRRR